MHYRFRWVYCFRQEEFVKIYFFLPITAHQNDLLKCIVFFRKTYESNLPFGFAFPRSTGARAQKTVRPSSATSLPEKLIKIGANVVSHGRCVTFQMVEVAVPRRMFREILSLIARLRVLPAPASPARWVRYGT